MAQAPRQARHGVFIVFIARFAIHPNGLRHAFATHLLEDGVDIRVIQTLLGHAKLEHTARYTQVATTTLRDVKGPLEHLSLQPEL